MRTCKIEFLVAAFAVALLVTVTAPVAAQVGPYQSVIDESQFDPSVLLNQNWREKPRNMKVIDIPGVAGSIIMLRNGLGTNGEPEPELQYETSNLPQESYRTELLDDILFDRMIKIDHSTGANVAHPIFQLGVNLSDTDMVRITVKRVFRKTAPSLSDDDAYAALKKMAERNFRNNSDERFYWVKAVELRTVTLQTFKEVKKAGSAGLFFFSGKKTYQFTDKAIGTREFIGIDVLTKTLSQIEADEPTHGDETRDIKTDALDDLVSALFTADIPFTKISD